MRFSTLLLAAACAAPLATAQTVEFPDQVYVANQGNFGANTSSITTFSAFSRDAPDELFGGALGSTVQSTILIGDRLYVMSDEAARIDVIDIGSNTRVAQIASDDVNSVRYMAEAGPGKAYVTQLYLPDGSFSGGSVAVVDLETNTFTEVINDASFSNPEGIAVVGGFAFVANAGFGAGTTLTAIDTSTDAVDFTVEIGCSARAVLPDLVDLQVYAFCSEEIVVVSAGVAAGGVPAIAARIAVPESVQPLGTGGLGQDAALGGPTSECSAGFYSMIAAGTGGVLLVDPSTETVRPLAIDGAASISAVGIAAGFDFDICIANIILGRPSAGNPFGANGAVTIHAPSGGGRSRATTPVSTRRACLSRRGSRPTPSPAPRASRLPLRASSPTRPSARRRRRSRSPKPRASGFACSTCSGARCCARTARSAPASTPPT